MRGRGDLRGGRIRMFVILIRIGIIRVGIFGNGAVSPFKIGSAITFAGFRVFLLVWGEIGRAHV